MPWAERLQTRTPHKYHQLFGSSSLWPFGCDLCNHIGQAPRYRGEFLCAVQDDPQAPAPWSQIQPSRCQKNESSRGNNILQGPTAREQLGFGKPGVVVLEGDCRVRVGLNCAFLPRIVVIQGDIVDAGVLVPAGHGVDGSRQLSTARLVDATGAVPYPRKAVTAGLVTALPNLGEGRLADQLVDAFSTQDLEENLSFLPSVGESSVWKGKL